MYMYIVHTRLPAISMPCVMYIGAPAPLRNVCMVPDTSCHTLYMYHWHCVVCGFSVVSANARVKASRIVGKSLSRLGAWEENAWGRIKRLKGEKEIIKNKDKFVRKSKNIIKIG